MDFKTIYAEEGNIPLHFSYIRPVEDFSGAARYQGL